MNGAADGRAVLAAVAAEMEGVYLSFAVQPVQGRDGLVLEARRRGAGPGLYVVQGQPGEVAAALEWALRAELIALQREFPAAQLTLWTGVRAAAGSTSCCRRPRPGYASSSPPTPPSSGPS